MKKKIINTYIKRHLSLIVILIGMVSFFLTNLFLKEKLNKMEFGQYSILISFFSTLFIYGVLGFEQVFIRYSNFKKNNFLETQKIQLKAVLIIGFLTSTAGFLTFKTIYPEIKLNFYLFIFATICTSLLPILFTVFRLNENYVFAQFIANGLKLFLFIMVFFLYFFEKINLIYLLNGILCCIVLVFLITLFEYLKKINLSFNLNYSNQTIITSFKYFFIAITSFTIINFIDRFIIESKFGFEIAGDYIYLSNIFLAPYAVLQNYVGFKKTVFYKNNFSKADFDKMNKKIILYGSILAGFLFFCSIFVDYLNILNFKFCNYSLIIFLMLTLGIIRLYSLSFNSAFDVIANNSNLLKANALIFSVTLLLIYLIVKIFNSMEFIIISISFLWFLRFLILRFYLNRQIKN